MALHQDALMRMIEKMARALGQIVAGKGLSPREQVEVLDEAIGDALRANPGMVHVQRDALLDHNERRLAAHLGRLMAIRAGLSGYEGHVREAVAMLRCASPRLRAGQEHDARTPLQWRAQTLGLPVSGRLWDDAALGALHAELFDDALADGQLAVAEDALFAALELDPAGAPALAARAAAALTPWLDAGEDALVAGGLSRAEIADALGELAEVSARG